MSQAFYISIEMDRRNNLLKICYSLSSPKILFWVLPLLMILIVVGTLAQKEIGLYRAIDIFFNGWIIWWTIIPIPGFLTLMSVFTINLFFRFIFRSIWIWSKSGLHLIHLGTLILMIGGIFTMTTAQEGFLAIGEGEKSRYVSDFHQRVLVLFEGNTVIDKINFEDIQQTDQIGPFSIQTLSKCDHCSIKEQKKPEEIHQGMAQFMKLESAEPLLENERNMSGLTLKINNLNKYILFEGMPKPIQLTKADGKQYHLILGKEQRTLPFDITLNRFEKQTYPGTDKAKEFISTITITDNDIKWDAKISMNKPLRYKGYTLYQSSYDQTADKNVSVFSVVENKGQIFPYLSCLIIGAGLILHLIIIVGRKTRT